jgi:hypothetical protein
MEGTEGHEVHEGYEGHEGQEGREGHDARTETEGSLLKTGEKSRNMDTITTQKPATPVHTSGNPGRLPWPISPRPPPHRGRAVRDVPNIFWTGGVQDTHADRVYCRMGHLAYNFSAEQGHPQVPLASPASAPASHTRPKLIVDRHKKRSTISFD